jgi:hypothetical protein
MEVTMNKQILKNDFLQLEYLPDSARITGFMPAGKSNLLADLPDFHPIPTPYGDFHFRGGHRLWHSPEAMPRTYMPDNEGGTAGELPDGVRMEMPAEPWTNIAKAIEIRLNPGRPQLTVRHEMRNDGPWAVEFSPWALTMFRLGGVGIFPQPQGNVDEAGLLANRQLALWPYTRLDDPRLILRDDFILLHATPSLPPLKFGYFNPHGWSAYWIDGSLFVKRHDVSSTARYPDNGCNTESYCNDQFVELESLGPLGLVAPGQTVVHIEVWELYDSLESSLLSDEIQEVIKDIS